MADTKKATAKKAAARKKAGPAPGEVETFTLSYLPAGVGISPERPEPTLDPGLVEIREAETERNAKVAHRAPIEEPSIDPELVEARKKELERDAKRAGVKLADTSAGKAEAAKKSTSKSSK